MTDLAGAAAAIGRRLCDAAVWHLSRCTWMGAHQADDGRAVELRPAGPDLYDGSAGIALFLAELAAADGDPVVRRVALGAARHARSSLERIEPAARLGFHAGQPGVGVGLARVGRLLGEDELVEAGVRVAARVADDGQRSRWPGLMSGLAGGIAALLVLADVADEPRLLRLADGFGEDLIALASRREEAWCWTYSGHPASAGLTGLGLGAAGVGWALLELSRSSGAAAFEAAARGALAYERGLFDPAEGNWLDLRATDGPSFHCAWCHGAPGIALARARAHELLGDDDLRGEAEVALATTERATRAMLASGRFNYSLCHGLAGNALVLMEGERLLGADGSPRSALAREVAEAGVDAYARRGRPWPGGTHVGEVPGLMTGLAGIGTFLMRAAGRTGPSVLLPRAAPVGAAVREPA